MDPTSQKSLFVTGSLIGGRYEVIDSLGSGGMGTVVRVIDRALNNEAVALKLLYPHMAKDQTSFARFRNEVLIARKLAHPNIVRLYDFGAAGQGYYYISMEYVEGGSLGDLIYGPREKRPQFQDCLEILFEICQGLSCAHSHGVMHRDLKPDNILLTTNSVVKISDFGLARSTTVDRGLTATGDTVGTPYYMAPEQLKGAKLDQRVDLYALGILAFEMVAGRLPFFHESYISLAHMHFSQPIPKIAGPESGIPQWFQEFVERCAAKKPEDRYASAEEAAAEIADHIGDVENSAIKRRPAVMSFYGEQKTTRKPTVKRRLGVWTLCTLALLFAFVGSVLLIRSSETLNSFFRRVLLSAENSTGVDATAFKEVIHGNIATADLFPAVVNGQKEIVADLLSSGVNPNLKDVHSMTALHHAARSDQSEIVSLLLKNGADVDSRDTDGRTALSSAAELGNTKVLEILLGAKARVEHKDSAGATALCLAAASGSVESVQRLLEFGARLNTADSKGKTPIMYALDNGKTQVAVDLAALPELDVNRADGQGNTALHYAAKAGDERSVGALIRAKANPKLKNIKSQTPLDLAPSRARRQFTKLLGSMPVREVYRSGGGATAATSEKTTIKPRGARSVRDYLSGLSLGASISQNIMNYGEVNAKDVKVYLKLKDGTRLQLHNADGGTEIPKKRTAKYLLKTTKVSPAQAQAAELEISCSNCN